jgi:hypothetical protein
MMIRRRIFSLWGYIFAWRMKWRWSSFEHWRFLPTTNAQAMVPETAVTPALSSVKRETTCHD